MQYTFMLHVLWRCYCKLRLLSIYVLPSGWQSKLYPYKTRCQVIMLYVLVIWPTCYVVLQAASVPFPGLCTPHVLTGHASKQLNWNTDINNHVLPFLLFKHCCLLSLFKVTAAFIQMTQLWISDDHYLEKHISCKIRFNSNNITKHLQNTSLEYYHDGMRTVCPF
jgi:hypothetical protein